MEIERLIEQCKQGNEEALGNLYKVYAHRMRGICQRYVSDPQAVDDVLHDAFIVIFTSLDRLKDETKAEAWMAGIVRNVAVKYGKRLMAVKTVSQEEITEDMLSAAAEIESTEPVTTLEELMQMVDRLPNGYGKVFRLSVFEGLSHKEIAEHLGIGPHSSSSQLTRAKKMMRKMIKQYWLWLLIPLLIPVSWIIINYKHIRVDKNISGNTTKEDRIINIRKDGGEEITEQGYPAKVAPTNQSKNPTIENLPIAIRQSSSIDTLQSVLPRISDLLTSDIPSDKKEGMELSDTILTKDSDSVFTIQKVEIPRNNIVVRNKKTSRQKDWNLAFAYNGSIQNAKSQTNNYMTIPALTNVTTRSTRIYNWGEYMDYVMENAPAMDSLSALNMYRVAFINSNMPQDPITEISKHERPLTIQLLFNRSFNSHWSITTGLSITGMKSTFESGNESTLIYRTQRIHYLGIPLRANFRMVEYKRMNIYTSGGIQLDFPISARLTTKYVYSNHFGTVDTSPSINATIHTPCQWSFGVGLGIQYQILPHLNLFFEPSLNYYIPVRGIETYRTEHPFDLSMPIGIKLSW